MHCLASALLSTSLTIDIVDSVPRITHRAYLHQLTDTLYVVQVYEFPLHAPCRVRVKWRILRLAVGLVKVNN